jgi:hypothetical protein
MCPRRHAAALPSSTHRLSDFVSSLYTMDSDAAWRALLQRATAGVHGSLNADHGTVRAACFALLEWACGHWQAAPPPPRSEGLMQMALHRASAPRGRRPWHWPGSASSRLRSSARSSGPGHDAAGRGGGGRARPLTGSGRGGQSSGARAALPAGATGRSPAVAPAERSASAPLPGTSAVAAASSRGPSPSAAGPHGAGSLSLGARPESARSRGDAGDYRYPPGTLCPLDA